MTSPTSSAARPAPATVLLGMLAAGGLAAALLAAPGAATAASSKGCDGGGFTVSGPGFSVAGDGDRSVPFSKLTAPFLVKGKYVEFTVVPGTFEVRDYLFTGVPNPLDMTGGRRTVVWASKVPDHRGLQLTGNAAVDLDKEAIELTRTGSGLTMKIQAKDCASGGVFQMEVERGDGTATRVTHTLAGGIFYFDNPNFRAREGDAVPYKDTTVVVTPRVNIAGDVSRNLVGRDSPQVATRVNEPSCSNPIRKRDQTVATVLHCGRVSRWDVASGGRMGWVTGEDATEVAPPATACTHKCQAQNRVRDRSTVLGFPFPVPAASRLQPAFPTP